LPLLTILYHSVNEIFDACRVDEFYHMSPSARLATVADNRATNYSVVRPELLDRLYEAMYHQRLYEPDSSKWQHQIIGNRELAGAEETRDGKLTLTLLDKINAAEVKDGKDGHNGHVEGAKGSTYQVDDVDLVITGTGYVRNAHETLLKPLSGLFVGGPSDVDRDYRLRLNGRADGCGIWLQGCCEQSHGVSYHAFS
jgi:L-ornithine N5-oxygenase